MQATETIYLGEHKKTAFTFINFQTLQQVVRFTGKFTIKQQNDFIKLSLGEI